MDQVKGTVNRVELIGWLGAEPEQRTLPNGIAVCNFRVATKRLAGRNDTGERTVETDWTPIEVWDRLAERCGRVLKKGSRVRVTGSLRTDTWHDRETGQRRSKLIVRADDVMFLDPRASDADPEVEDVLAMSEVLPF